MSRKSFSDKIALAAGTATAVAAPVAADAAIVTNYNSISVSQFDIAPGTNGVTYVGRDIDGVGGPDISLFALGSHTSAGLAADGFFGLGSASDHDYLHRVYSGTPHRWNRVGGH